MYLPYFKGAREVCKIISVGSWHNLASFPGSNIFVKK